MIQWFCQVLKDCRTSSVIITSEVVSPFMNENMDHLTRLQDFFRSLFQFDLADLDFGLYRLFHLKRAEIEAFITEQLPREVDAAVVR